jgi:general secretion pathway protein A
MYTNFFGFHKKPFNVTPDPDVLYMSRYHQEALASIIYGIRERRGFITIVGEVGTGKTTLLNATLRALDSKTRYAFIFNTDLTFEELLQRVLIDLGLASTESLLPKFIGLDRLNRYATELFAEGGNIVVIIDEAQNLDASTLENLRLLSNLETSKHKLVQIVLSGQPELDEKLRKKELRQLAQRINMRRYIMPLDKENTYKYIEHQLKLAGYRGRQLFGRSALKQIWAYSQGIPRKINMLSDNALLIGYGLGKKRISSSVIREAIRDLTWSPYPLRIAAKKRKNAASVGSDRFKKLRYAIGAVLLAGFFLGAGSLGLWASSSVQKDEVAGLTKQYFFAISGVYDAFMANLFKIDADVKRSYPVDVLETSEADREKVTSAKQRSSLSPPAEPPKKTGGDREDSFGDGGRHFKNVVVKEGDSLYDIVVRTYGKNDKILAYILRANPQIEDPDKIIPGQVVQLPQLNRTEHMPRQGAENKNIRPEHSDNYTEQ